MRDTIFKRLPLVLIAFVTNSCSKPLMEVDACINGSQLGLVIKPVEHWYGNEQPKIQTITVVQYGPDGQPLKSGPVWGSRLREPTSSTGTPTALIVYGHDPAGFWSYITAHPLQIGQRFYADLDAEGYQGVTEFSFDRSLSECQKISK